MTINHTPFQQHVDDALSLLRVSGYSGLADIIGSVHETDDTFEAFTDGYRAWVGSPVAEWPEENDHDQVAILATYLGHEAVHIQLYQAGNPNWNTDVGEQQAMAVQQEIGRTLGVPDVYVLCPLQAIPSSYIGGSRTRFIPNPDLLKLGGLVAVAFAGMLIARVSGRGSKQSKRNPRRNHRALHSLYRLTR